MDRTTRWETEAIRGGGTKRQSPPKPTRKRAHSTFTDNRHWVTLREAEEATGIPTNTLRKWVRKADLPSYLEADGDLALRMVDLDAVVARAKKLGRDLVPPSGETGELESASSDLSPGGRDGPSGARVREGEQTERGKSDSPPGTMIVPIDAWNKMLNQLGNLHEAGQDLAVARERAAKAETEVSFLRERLAEIRTEKPSAISHQPSEQESTEAESAEPEPEAAETTTYWRYLTTGWRARRKHR
jgi:hypothetical protein